MWAPVCVSEKPPGQIFVTGCQSEHSVFFLLDQIFKGFSDR